MPRLLPVLGFGGLWLWLGGLGQTSHIAMFTSHYSETLALSAGDISLLYGTATIVAALPLAWLGRLVDTYSPKQVVRAVCWLAVLSAAIGMLVTNATTLFLAYLSWRLVLFGLVVLMSITLATRAAPAYAGRVVGGVAYGAFISQITFPALSGILLPWFDDARWVWAIYTVLIAALVPALLLLLTRLKFVAPTDMSEPELMQSHGSHAPMTSAQLLRDPAFVWTLPAQVSPGLLGAGLLFHHHDLLLLLQLDTDLWIPAFILQALTVMACAYLFGMWVDKHGSRIAIYLSIALLALCFCLLILPLPANSALFLAMFCMGCSMGMFITSWTPYWARTYGLDHLGHIRGLSQSLGICATAFGPILVGVMLTWEVEYAVMLSLGLAWLSFAIVCMLFAPNRERQHWDELKLMKA